MHQAADVILVVTDAEFSLDGYGQPSGCPAVGGESVRHGAFGVHGANGIDLIGCQPARPAGGFALAQTIDAFMNDRAVPAGSGCAAYAIAAGHL